MTTSLTLPVPVASSLEGYVHSVNALPMLSAEQEHELATRFRLENDLDAARTLVMSHLRVVVSIARGYAGYGLPQADLIQEGNIGLMKAVKRYDPDRGVRLVSFAVHWIKAEIHEYIVKNWRLVKIATTKAQRKLFFNLRSLKSGLDSLRPHEIKAIAQELNVSEQDVVEMEGRFSGHEVPLDPTSGEEDESYAPAAWLAVDADTHEPSRVLENLESEHLKTEGLRNALASLDDRSRRIIESRWLREGDTATLHELAAEYGISAERIRQIEQKALAKMQAVLAPPALASSAAG